MRIIDRIIEVRVSGSYLTRDSQTAGVQGEANAAALRIAFDPVWDGMTKTIVWWNAKGEQEVRRILTADLLEDITADPRLYLAPIPGEAMTEAGKCRFAIDGYVAGKRQRSVYSELVVLPTGGRVPETEDPTPTQAEQLQTQMDLVLDTLREGVAGAEAAVTSAASAAASERSAAASARAAEESERAAAADGQTAVDSAAAARSYAEGGTGTREGEDRANAKYYMEQAQKMAGGEFLTEEQLEQRLEQLTAEGLGAAEKSHTHSADDITDGTLPSGQLPKIPVSKGGTGRSSLTANRYLMGNGTDAVALRTPAQVLADIGAAASDHTHSASSVGAVPAGRTVNGKSLDADIKLTAADVGARSKTWVPTAAEVGARSSTWLPTALEVGAAPSGYGLGEATRNSEDANAELSNGYFRATSVTANAPFNGAAVHVMAYNGDSVVQDFFRPASREHILRYGYKGKNDASMQWVDEYVNPYLSADGTEYRTPDRIAGKTVYKRNNGGIIEYRLDGETMWRGTVMGVTVSAADIAAGTTALGSGCQYLVYE